MAKTKKNGKELATLDETNALPSYLTNNEKTTGLEALNKDDFKVQRIKLIQPTSPEARVFAGKALPTEFWHTGANRSLGREFFATPIIVAKKVVLWPPRDAGNEDGILALSRDGVTWDAGANKVFEVKLKDSKRTAKWSTGKNVTDSGLLEFGSSDSEDDSSPPAATLFYEYLLYLKDYPELSPVAMSMFRTALPNARSFNTYLLSRRAPINCNMIKIFSEEQSKGKNVWHVPHFEPAGNAPKEIYELTKEMQERYSSFEAELDREDMQQSAAVKSDDI